MVLMQRMVRQSRAVRSESNHYGARCKLQSLRTNNYFTKGDIMKWFMNLKTAVKLISAFVIVAIIVAVVGVYAIFNLSMMNNNIQEMYNNNLTSVQTLSS